jgi:hypothetical protein
MHRPIHLSVQYNTVKDIENQYKQKEWLHDNYCHLAASLLFQTVQHDLHGDNIIWLIRGAYQKKIQYPDFVNPDG